MDKTDSCQRGGVLGEWMKEGEGIKQKKCLYICLYIYTHIHICLSISVCIHVYTHTHINTDDSVMSARGKGRWGEVEVGKVRGNGDEKRLC